jgi:hypothetical protein
MSIPLREPDEKTGAHLAESAVRVAHPTHAAAGLRRSVQSSRLVPLVALLGMLALGSTTIACDLVRGPQPEDSSAVVPVSPTVSPGFTTMPSATPKAAPTPSQTAAPSTLTWTAAPTTASMRGARMTAIAVGRDEYVAVGCTLQDDPDYGEAGAAWTSPDGVAWTSSDVEKAKDSCLYGVISTPDGHLAWGQSNDPEYNGAAFWQSDDGSTWTRARSIKSFAGQDVAEVVHFGGRFVAFGSHDPAEVGQKARIWVSPDGLRWSNQSRAQDCDDGRTSDPASLAAIYTALVDGDEVVTIGATRTEYVRPADTGYIKPAEGVDPGTGEELLIEARSRDTRCWTVTYTPVSTWTRDAVLAANGLVGVGRQHPTGLTPPLITASSFVDGSAWTPSTFSPEAPEGTLERVAAGDRGLLAMGPVDNGEPLEDLGDDDTPTDEGPPRGTEPSAWWSADGRTWQRTAAPDATATVFTDLIAIPGGFLTVGWSTPLADPTAEVWIGR